MGSDGTIIKTVNAGNNWITQSSGTYFWLFSVFFTDTNTGYAVGEFGKILKTTNGGGTGIEENQLPESGIIIYPNPATFNIIIETSQKSEIEIVNINGQIIKTINHDSGEITVDIRDLSGGVYIIKAKTDKEIVTKKFLKQ